MWVEINSYKNIDVGIDMKIILNNLEKYYGQELVFKDFSYTFRQGNIYFIMGASGCGKTSLIKMVLGLEKYQSGSIRVEELCSDRSSNLDISRNERCNSNRELFSYVPQEDCLLENMSIYNNMKMVLDEISHEKLSMEMSKIGLEMTTKKRVRELSGGQKRRVSILRAVLYGKDVLIMDEPFKGLDEVSKKLVMDYCIARMTTALIVSHSEDEFTYFKEKLGDRLILVNL